VDDITVEVKEEGAEHQLFQAQALYLDVMVIIGLALLRTGAAAAAQQYSSHLETRAS
jgi:hypothetical protein